jgi:hypothetical protein
MWWDGWDGWDGWMYEVRELVFCAFVVEDGGNYPCLL